MPDHPYDRRRRRRQRVSQTEVGGAQLELTLRVLRHTSIELTPQELLRRLLSRTWSADTDEYPLLLSACSDQ